MCWSKGGTKSCGTNARFSFDVNVMLNLSIEVPRNSSSLTRNNSRISKRSQTDSITESAVPSALGEIRLLIVLFVCLYFLGYALKCNRCFSGVSWDDCKHTAKQVNCSDTQDRCGAREVKYKSSDVAVIMFSKGCVSSPTCSEKYCKSFKSSRSLKITKCKLDCCKGDLCNGAKVPMVTAIMLLANAIVAVAR